MRGNGPGVLRKRQERGNAGVLGKKQEEQRKHLKTFAEDPKLEVLDGRYGPYLVYDGKNYRLPKSMHEKAAELTLEECMKIINR